MTDTATAAPAPHADLNPLSDADFRRTVRDWIAANYPPELRNPPKRLHAAEAMPWYHRLSAQGWLAPGWPREHGGMGLSPAKLLIMMEEMERHGCARLPDSGLTMVGPLLIAHGSEQQRAYHLPRILSGEIIWCQGYSEPNAGSDLAALRTSAVRDGEEWVLNGQKIWTTLGTDANWIFVLARTDPEAAKQKGISFFLVPMDTPGLTVRPIVNIDRHDEFAEVFFDNVRIPADAIVGAVNAGWTIAKNLLGFERLFLGSPKQAEGALDHLERLAAHLGCKEDCAALVNGLRMELEDHKSFYATFADQVRRGETLGPDVSMLKINQTALYQKITDRIMELAGELGTLAGALPDDPALYPGSVFLQARPSSIYGGSSEIQRNIVAKQVLGLGR
ncbi:acyl-CoA dehydrogenase family protein [Nitratireductor sp. ZSWI3]|uniref:acyl-CoA dehydrogenase family protein n=1 Tax=Nitratireductor sp. ZSWI3 TaxID=2966359 RepID=UPI00214FEF05|nr:acyl-CoA dehydrogenase family protein [Nitratireductor sp. ZSWI3]MCR4265284.1 acyl-CoA dehydrogenase family protein [Nitratireductor sp. ZSWI3]